jgi:flagella basal body P-ring formation protein FlgA
MVAFTMLVLALAFTAPSAGAAQDAVRAAIASAVSGRLGAVRAVDVEVVSSQVPDGRIVSAAPMPGGRLGHQMRFLVTPASGRPVAVVARINVIAAHAVAAGEIARGESIAAEDVAWKEGPLRDQLLEPLPALADIVGARARRSIAAGETFSRTMLARPLDVRAGDELTLTFRSGAIEVQGVGRAVSGGAIGDVIRVTSPGSRDIRRARITAPSAAEIVR